MLIPPILQYPDPSKWIRLIFLTLYLLTVSCDNMSHITKQINEVFSQTEKNLPPKPRKESLLFKKGEEYLVKVVGIADGDTFTGLTDINQQVKCRMYGIDAPEKRQPFANRSKEALSYMIFGKEVRIKIEDKDRYGRAVVRVYSDGKDVSVEMIRAGMAWHYKEYSKEREYADLEAEARRQSVGLWVDKNPVEPWKFRKESKTQ